MGTFQDTSDVLKDCIARFGLDEPGGGLIAAVAHELWRLASTPESSPVTALPIRLNPERGQNVMRAPLLGPWFSGQEGCIVVFDNQHHLVPEVLTRMEFGWRNTYGITAIVLSFVEGEECALHLIQEDSRIPGSYGVLTLHADGNFHGLVAKFQADVLRRVALGGSLHGLLQWHNIAVEKLTAGSPEFFRERLPEMIPYLRQLPAKS